MYMSYYMYVHFFSCQFIVREGAGDYSVYCNDPDLLVDWECIEQVVSNYMMYYSLFTLNYSDCSVMRFHLVQSVYMLPLLVCCGGVR